MNNYQKLLISILFIVNITGGGAAFAEVLTCDVGDVSKGYWSLVSAGEGCLYPGPPAEDSPWPTDPDQLPSGHSSGAYRIEGIYKISTYMSSEGYSATPPPERPACITGYAEAYAAADCTRRQSYIHEPQPSNHIQTFSTKGTLGIWSIVNIANGVSSEIKRYLRFFEIRQSRYKWKCKSQPIELPVKNNNAGTPPSICPVK